jgi:hypothetical protein
MELKHIAHNKGQQEIFCVDGLSLSTGKIDEKKALEFAFHLMETANKILLESKKYGHSNSLMACSRRLEKVIDKNNEGVASTVNEKGERNHEIMKAVLNGSKLAIVGIDFNISANTVRTIFLRECRKRNSNKYESGILKGATNNYKTPPLKYLRENKSFFLND